MPSNAANGSAAAADTGLSGLLAKGSRTGVVDELLDPVKSPKASPPLPKASKTLAAGAGDGAAKSSKGEDEDAAGDPKASKGDGLGFTGAAAAGDVMLLNGSRDAAEFERLPARLVGVGASNASNGEEATGAGLLGVADAGASNPNGSSAFFVGLRPMRSFVAGVVAFTLEEEKLDPGGGAILNDPSFGAGGGGVAFGAGFEAALVELLEPSKSPKSANPSSAFLAGAGVS
jgi:hypothetical protein